MIVADRLAHTSRRRNDPLAEKVFLSLGLLVLAMTLPSWPGAALVFAAASGCALAAGTGLRDWLRLLVPPFAFILTGSAALLVQAGGDGIGWAADGPRAALDLLLRSGASVSALLLLTATTPAAALVQGLRRLGLPAELAEVTLLTYRFIFILLDTAAAMQAGQEARLGCFGWKRRIRSLGMLVGALLPRAMDKARRMEAGLAARGFDGSLPTLAPAHPPRPGRLAATAGLLALIAGAGLWM